MMNQQYLEMENENKHMYHVHFGIGSCSDSYDSDSNDSDESCDGKPPPKLYQNVVKIHAPLKPKCEGLNQETEKEWNHQIQQTVRTDKNFIKQETKSLHQSLLNSVISKYCKTCGQITPNLTASSVLTENETLSNSNSDFDLLQDFNKTNMLTSFEDFGISAIFFCKKQYIQKYVKTNANIISISTVPQFKNTISFVNKNNERNIRIETIVKLNSLTENKNNYFGAFFIPELIQNSKPILTKRKENSSVEKQKLNIEVHSNNKHQHTEFGNTSYHLKFFSKDNIEQIINDPKSLANVDFLEQDGKTINNNEDTFGNTGARNCFIKPDMDINTKMKILNDETKSIVNNEELNTKYDVDPRVTIHEHPDIAQIAELNWSFNNNVTETKRQSTVNNTFSQMIVEENILLTNINLEESKLFKDSKNRLLENVVEKEIQGNISSYNSDEKKTFEINDTASTFSCDENKKSEANKSRSKKKKQINCNTTENCSNTKNDPVSSVNENSNFILPFDNLKSLLNSEKELVNSIILNEIEENVDDEKINEVNSKQKKTKHIVLDPPSTIEHPYIAEMAKTRKSYNSNIETVEEQILKEAHNDHQMYKFNDKKSSDEQIVLIKSIYNNHVDHTMDQVENNKLIQAEPNKNILLKYNDEKEFPVNICCYNTDTTKQSTIEGDIKTTKSKKRKEKKKSNHGSDNTSDTNVPLAYIEPDLQEKFTDNLRNISDINIIDCELSTTVRHSKGKKVNLVLTLLKQEDPRKVNIYDSFNEQDNKTCNTIEIVTGPNAEINQSELFDRSSNLCFQETFSKNRIKEGLANLTILDQNRTHLSLETNNKDKLMFHHSKINSAKSDEDSEPISQISSFESVFKLNSNCNKDVTSPTFCKPPSNLKSCLVNNQVQEESMERFQTLKSKNYMRKEISSVKKFSGIGLENCTEKRCDVKMSIVSNDYLCHEHFESSLSSDENREKLFEGNNRIKSFSSPPIQNISTFSSSSKKCIIS